MILKCLHCGKSFEGTISLDELGWHSSCPDCKGSFDVDVPQGKIKVFFAETYDVRDSSNLAQCTITEVYVYDTFENLLNFWNEKKADHEGDWYFVYHNRELIINGAFDVDDICTLESYFKVGE